MKSNAIVCAIAACALGTSSLSFAQGHGDRDGRGERQGHAQRADRPDRPDRAHRANRIEQQEARQESRRQNHQPRYEARHHQAPQYQQRHYQPQYSTRYQAPRYQGRGYQWSGHDRRYVYGEVLPYQFRQRQYYVNDWRAHRGLYAPPYGYQWVQSDAGDFLLVALATGLIANLLLNQY